MKKNIVSLLICFLLIGTNFSFAQGDIDEQAISSAVLAEYQTGDIMYSHNLDKRIEIASITKIMSYLVAMDEISKGNANLSDIVVISKKASERGGSSFKLKAGQTYKLGALIESSLIASANDACIAIAEHISGDEKTFIELMNKKAKELELEQAQFVSVNGFPEEGPHNTMSSRDILKLTRHIINKYPQVLDTTSKQILVDKERGFEFINTNPLLGIVKGVVGLKTGYSDAAGYCLVSVKNTEDGKLIGIVMGAGNQSIRKGESIKLLDGDISKKYNKEKILSSDVAVDAVLVPGSANGKVKVFVEDDVYGMISGDEEVSKTISIYDYLEFPLKSGQPVGQVVVKYGNNTKRIDLVAKEEIVKDTFLNTLAITMRGFIRNAF